jgi:choline-glycine betaine transporter
VRGSSVAMAGDAEDNEELVKATLARSPFNNVVRRWVSCGTNNWVSMRFNWVTSMFAVIILWGFAIACMAGDDEAKAATLADLKTGKAWVSANFTWLYIGTQDVWSYFLIYLCFSRFANLKLGGDNEKPRYNDFTWFTMLFTCGVAVGLYVFGVAEPLYFYRQPSVWHSWNYDYQVTKVAVQNDAQRAQQAIFMAVYHWGIHGWVPYILLALLIGIVSYRWGMPMTIRSCFYPLIGDHALGIVGDFIDALSISTTTFGVCTSLGLGVQQLARGLQFLQNIGCSEKTNCEAAGGTWKITGYGKDNCHEPDSTPVSCKLSFLANATGFQDAQVTIIGIVTLLATVSVLTGLDRGIKTLSKLAFSLGAIVMISVLYADNSWYLLNVMVQTTGYYIQYVIQVGFDCEAFQQLGFEFQAPPASKYWGSSGDDTVYSKLMTAGFTDFATTTDCGDKINPCKAGMYAMSIGAALAAKYWTAGVDPEPSLYTIETANKYEAVLKTHKVSAHSTDQLVAAYGTLKDIYGGGLMVPCGNSADNSTLAGYFNNATITALGFPSTITETTALCANAIPGKEDECKTFWAAPAWPRCPETVLKDELDWGRCQSYLYSCPISTAYFDDSNPNFMDWWTIFYWAWWITWAPFVGFFVAIISRGRTVREVIIGGFFCPTAFAILWFSVFGGLAVKMERVAEVALKVAPDWSNAAATCAEHYSGGVPITPDSKKLAELGYYMIHCFHKDDQIYLIMEQYKNIAPLLHIFLWFGLVVYFLTSSDSGSMTDDIISASGLSAGKIPYWQKVFWCFTEGIVAISLVVSGGGGSDTLKSLQAASIIIGLPFTFLLCLMVPSLYRAMKRELGDEDILTSKRFNTQLLDIFEFFKPNGGSPCSPMQHIKCIVVGLVVPFVGVHAAFAKVYPDQKLMAIAYGATTQLLFIAWFCLQISEVDKANMHVLGWLCMTGVLMLIALARGEVRRLYNIWGNPLEDFWAAMCMYPFVLAQIQMQCDTDGLGAPTYFKSLDDMQAELKKVQPEVTGGDIPMKELPPSETAGNGV